mmetsp:Transcript_48027/g.95837  ORF Transcript_48027/g.95837 Transcript_48027/m.95837 type:complete len:238 (-) Transcript_48027:265-978(-)
MTRKRMILHLDWLWFRACSLLSPPHLSSPLLPVLSCLLLFSCPAWLPSLAMLIRCGSDDPHTACIRRLNRGLLIDRPDPHRLLAPIPPPVSARSSLLPCPLVHPICGWRVALKSVAWQLPLRPEYLTAPHRLRAESMASRAPRAMHDACHPPPSAPPPPCTLINRCGAPHSPLVKPLCHMITRALPPARPRMALLVFRMPSDTPALCNSPHSSWKTLLIALPLDAPPAHVATRRFDR